MSLHSILFQTLEHICLLHALKIGFSVIGFIEPQVLAFMGVVVGNFGCHDKYGESSSDCGLLLQIRVEWKSLSNCSNCSFAKNGMMFKLMLMETYILIQNTERHIYSKLLIYLNIFLYMHPHNLVHRLDLLDMWWKSNLNGKQFGFGSQSCTDPRSVLSITQLKVLVKFMKIYIQILLICSFFKFMGLL